MREAHPRPRRNAQSCGEWVRVSDDLLERRDAPSVEAAALVGTERPEACAGVHARR
jgi:hypothetical protein